MEGSGRREGGVGTNTPQEHPLTVGKGGGDRTLLTSYPNPPLRSKFFVVNQRPDTTVLGPGARKDEGGEEGGGLEHDSRTWVGRLRTRPFLRSRSRHDRTGSENLGGTTGPDRDDLGETRAGETFTDWA